MRILKKLEKLGDYLTKFIEKTSFVLFFASLLFGIEQVFARNFFRKTIPCAEEVIVLMMLYSLFLASIIATKNNHHIKLDFLVVNVTGKAENVMKLFHSCLEFGTCVFLLAIYVQYEIRLYKTGSILMCGLDFPMWIAQMSLGLCFAGIIFFSFIEICKILSGRGKEEE